MVAEKGKPYADVLWQMAQKTDWPETRVSFTSTNTALTERMAAAAAEAKANVRNFLPDSPVIIEGGGYNRIFLETQPMGGLAYARYDVRPGLNNQIFFLLKQRGDGRLAGAVVPQTAVSEESKKDVYLFSDAATGEYGLVADFGQLQGNALPYPAFLHYYWAGKPAGYLEALAAGVEAFDDYLWRTRDPDGEGVLQQWGIWDTGEDNCTRFYASPNRWPHDYPPVGTNTPDRTKPEDELKYYQWFHGEVVEEKLVVPTRSMDMTAYSAENLYTLALISEEINDGKAGDWLDRLETVRKNFTKVLWRPERSAAFDKDRNNEWMDVLLHNNLRCMYYNLFTKEQAEAFVRAHLFNPDEFFTPMPLPSIAANEPLFRNAPGNNWSGSPQGLTWQRLPRALGNYGMYAELTKLGKMFVEAICKVGVFAQQFDAFQFGVVPEENRKHGGYGPTIFAFVDYVSRLYGVCLEHDTVLWSGLVDGENSHTYTQHWNGHDFSLQHDASGVRAVLDGKTVFTASAGLRVVTDLDGKLKTLVGISEEPVSYQIQTEAETLSGTLAPNQIIHIS